MPTHPKPSAYDDYAAEYAAYVAWREQDGIQDDPLGILPHLLDLVGDVTGRAVLDAGCGEGYLARILAARGAAVTGIDLSPGLVAMARARDPDGAITYRVADLSGPLPGLGNRFDAVASFMALDDVADHRGFAATIAAVLKPGGRAVLAFNNPYAWIVRKRIAAYFASGTMHRSGLARAGIEVPFYYRTLSEYLDAFLAAGLRLTQLVDVDDPSTAAERAAGRPLPRGEELPRFMILAFTNFEQAAH